MGFICAFLLATTFCKIPSSNAAILDTPAGKMMVRTLFQMMKISPINCDGSFIMNVYGTSKLRYPHFCEYDSSNSDKCIPYRKMKEDNTLHTTMCSIWDNVRDMTENQIIDFFFNKKSNESISAEFSNYGTNVMDITTYTVERNIPPNNDRERIENDHPDADQEPTEDNSSNVDAKLNESQKPDMDENILESEEPNMDENVIESQKPDMDENIIESEEPDMDEKVTESQVTDMDENIIESQESNMDKNMNSHNNTQLQMKN